MRVLAHRREARAGWPRTRGRASNVVPGERSAAQRQDVSRFVSVPHPGEVARQHPRVREHVVAEQHRLRPLQMRVAGQNDVEVLLGKSEKCAPDALDAMREIHCAPLRVQPCVRRHLVVATAGGVQPCACGTDSLRRARARSPCGRPRRRSSTRSRPPGSRDRSPRGPPRSHRRPRSR